MNNHTLKILDKYLRDVMEIIKSCPVCYEKLQKLNDEFTAKTESELK